MKFRSSLFAICSLVIMSCTAPTVEEELYEEQAEIAVELSAQEEALFKMVNNYRESVGLSRLTFSNNAYPYAKEHNEYMIAKGKLSHDQFNKRASMVSKATAANFVAENVAKNYQFLDMALEGWLASEPHKNTIEGDFTHATLCITEDAEGNPYYTQIFFRKKGK